MSPRVHGEIEFEFREDGEGDGRFVACGKMIRTLRRMLAEDEIEAAAKLFAACADDVGDELIDDVVAGASPTQRMRSLAQMFYLAKDFARAAHCAEHTGDLDLAARSLAEQGDLEAAAELYRRSGELARAAALLERNRSFARAAELHLQLKDHPRAASTFERAGKWLQAGQIYAQLGRFDAALAVLQRVLPEDPAFAAATLLVGSILEHVNNEAAAQQRYWAVVQQGDPTPEAWPVWLRLATSLADSGETGEARQLVDRLLKVDPANAEALALARQLPAPTERNETQSTFELEIAAPTAQRAAAPPRAAPPQEPSRQTAATTINAPQNLPPSRENRMIGVDHDFEFLRRVPIFARLSLGQQKYVCRLCSRVRFEPGEQLIGQGQPGEAMFVIIRGRVDVRSENPDGSGSLVADLGPGSHVGEMALIDDAPTSATVVARDTVYAYRLGRDQFEALLQANEKIQLRIYAVLVRSLINRLREANAKLAERAD